MTYIDKIIKIEYGVENNYIDITNHFNINNILRISKDINLNETFGDPIIGTTKHIKIQLFKNNKIETIYKNKQNNHLEDDIILCLKTDQIPKDIYGVYYICCFGSYYLDIVEEQLTILTNSGLYNDSKKILIFITLYEKDKCNILDEKLTKFDTNNKFQIITSELNLYEKFAINNYKQYIDSDDYYMYYFHTKGITRINEPNSPYHSRRKNLNYYILQNYKLCLQYLKEYDAVGCSLSRYPLLHFSGNFWWTKSSHTYRLPNKINNEYLACEMYICCHEGKFISLDNNTNDISYETLISDDYQKNNHITEDIIDNICHKNLLTSCT